MTELLIFNFLSILQVCKYKKKMQSNNRFVKIHLQEENIKF